MGSIIHPNNPNPQPEQPQSKIREEQAEDGSVRLVHENGAFVAFHSNGTFMVSDVHGSLVTSNPHGGMMLRPAVALLIDCPQVFWSRRDGHPALPLHELFPPAEGAQDDAGHPGPAPDPSQA